MKKNHCYNAVIDYLDANPDRKIKETIIDFSSYDENAKIHIASNLTAFRKRLGLSQAAMCNLLDISTSQYKKYESGSEVIRMDVVHKLSLKYGLPMFDLLARSKYASLLNIDDKYSGLHKVCFYANSLTDEYFEKLCHLLLLFSKTDKSIDITLSGITTKDFDLALEENENHIYISTAEGIRAARHHFNYSQEHMADLMNVSVSTYQEYEKLTQRPRFNMLMPARYVVATGLSPFTVLIGTHYIKIRFMQNCRIEIIKEILCGMDSNVTDEMYPMVDGFIDTVKSLPNSTFFPW